MGSGTCLGLNLYRLIDCSDHLCPLRMSSCVLSCVFVLRPRARQWAGARGENLGALWI